MVLWVRSFCGATMGQMFKILTWRDFGPLRHSSRKFPSRIFYPFWAPRTRKLRIGLFDRRGTKWCFWPRATKIYVLFFWPLCDQERPQKSATTKISFSLFVHLLLDRIITFTYKQFYKRLFWLHTLNIHCLFTFHFFFKFPIWLVYNKKLQRPYIRYNEINESASKLK